MTQITKHSELRRPVLGSARSGLKDLLEEKRLKPSSQGGVGFGQAEGGMVFQHGTLYKCAALASGKYGSSTRGWLQGVTREAVQLVMGDLRGHSGQELGSGIRPGFNS